MAIYSFKHFGLHLLVEVRPQLTTIDMNINEKKDSPEDFSLPSIPSNAFVVISKRASRGEVRAPTTELLAGLSDESLSDLSDRESSSADRGLRFGAIRPKELMWWALRRWLLWWRVLCCEVSKSQGLTIPRFSLLTTFVQCFGLWDRMSSIRKEVKGFPLPLSSSGGEANGRLSTGLKGTETVMSLGSLSLLDSSIRSLLYGLKYSSSEEELSFSSPGSMIEEGVEASRLNISVFIWLRAEGEWLLMWFNRDTEPDVSPFSALTPLWLLWLLSLGERGSLRGDRAECRDELDDDEGIFSTTAQVAFDRWPTDSFEFQDFKDLINKKFGSTLSSQYF